MRRTVTLDWNPLDWYHLIKEADAITERTGWGLASVWAHINKGDYQAALLRLQGIDKHFQDHPVSNINRGKKELHQAEYLRWRRENDFTGGV